MATTRHSPARSVAAHAILIAYTIIALFPVLVIVVNSFKTNASARPVLPDEETFSLIGYQTVWRRATSSSTSRTT